MARKYQTWFYFADTESEAKAICYRENTTGSYYKRKTYPAHYTTWDSADGTEHKWIVWTTR